MAYYIDGGNGASLTDATYHADPECDWLDGTRRPVAESTVDSLDGVTYCPCMGDAIPDGVEEVPPDAEADATGEGDETAPDPADGDESEPEKEGYLRDAPPETQIEEGVCPWCPPDDRYEGDHVGQHASSAHPDEWAAYKD